MKHTRTIAVSMILALVPLARAQTVVFPVATLTGTGQTSTAIRLNQSFSVGVITVTGSSLTTATFAVLGSSDGGTTYSALATSAVGSPSTTATSTTVTANGLYQVNLAGITNVEFQTSGTFTATNLSLLLTASSFGTIGRNGTGGAPTAITQLTGDVTAGPGAGSVAATVQGLKAVPFCTGFTPTNGQVVSYTTASSPNPCYTASTPASGGITALTGDATASGSGSVPITLATVNSGPGTCGDSTHGCSITTVGKGLVTAQTAVTVPVQLVSTFLGVPANSQITFYAPTTVALTFPASCTNSKMTATVAATGSTAFTVKDLTTSTTLCTATFAASGTTATWSGTGGSASAGDVLQIQGPATADATLANIGAAVYATR